MIHVPFLPRFITGPVFRCKLEGDVRTLLGGFFQSSSIEERLMRIYRPNRGTGG